MLTHYVPIVNISEIPWFVNQILQNKKKLFAYENSEIKKNLQI